MDVLGTNENDSANPGCIGELFQLSLPVSKAITLTTGVVANILSQQLPGGNYFAQAVIAYNSPNGLTVPADVKQGISTVSKTTGNVGSFTYDALAVAMPEDLSYVSPVVPISFPVEGGTIYSVALSDFASGALKAYGTLNIWRRR
jgi:hypothetical protein